MKKKKLIKLLHRHLDVIDKMLLLWQSDNSTAEDSTPAPTMPLLEPHEVKHHIEPDGLRYYR